MVGGARQGARGRRAAVVGTTVVVIGSHYFGLTALEIVSEVSNPSPTESEHHCAPPVSTCSVSCMLLAQEGQ